MKLKRILSIFAILCVVVTFAANTQRVLKIYSHNEVIGSFPIAVIDSIKIDKSTPSDKLIKIYQNNEISDFSIANIDSVKIEEEIEINPEDIPDNEIWYTTIDRKIVEPYRKNVFGANIISNTYTNKGVIKFDSAITEIGQDAFLDVFDPSNFKIPTLSQIYIPKSVNIIGERAFCGCTNLKHVYLPNQLFKVSKSAFNECIKLQEFHTDLASDDKKCLIVDSTIVAFAPYKISEYTTPIGVKCIAEGAFRYAYDLQKIIVSEGVKCIEYDAFGACSKERNIFDKYYDLDASLEEVYLPSTLNEIGPYAFCHQYKIKKFYGDCKFISDDGYSLIIDNYFSGMDFLVQYASGAELTSYKIPEGVGAIESYAFYKAKTLKELTFPSTLTDIASQDVFLDCYNIEKIYGTNVLDDEKSLVIDNTLKYVAPKGLKEYTTPPGVTNLSYGVLAQKPELESVVISDDVLSVEDAISCRPYEIPLGYILWNNPKLKTITISANIRILGMDPFGDGGASKSEASTSIETVYLRTPIPPIIGHNTPDSIPSLFPNLTIYVPEQSLEAYISSPDWAPYKGYIKGYNYSDLPVNDTYISTDFSTDGIVTTLQTATKGKGIDIVLMGDAYSDRQIADGTYAKDMEFIYNNLFTEEPYKSFKDYFNVHYVSVVSATKGYEYGNTALDTYFGDGTLVGGNDNAVFTYAQKAISAEQMDEALIIVAMNSDNYAGTCYMYYPEGNAGYGNGVSVSYFPKGGDEETFAQLLHHEACGHGFAKLADEYAYEYMGAAPSDYILQTQDQQNAWGWYKNVDFTSDLSQIRWAHFLNDSRYQYDGLGAFEGGLTYWRGVWRPTENSIMLYNTGGFNAPSREAIYYRIHKLAYGDDWVYNYEDFVKYDEINRKTAATSIGLKSIPEVKKDFVPLHEPVIVKKSWREAK